MAELSSLAKQTIEKLSVELTCPICLKQYTDPKQLHCLHVVCEKCLKAVARQTPQGQVVECPNCRHPTSLTQEGVPGLQGASLIKCSKHPAKELDLYCETCKEVICRDCIVKVHREHQYHVVTEAFPQQKDTVLVEPAKKQLASVNKSLEGLDTQRGEITSQRQALEARIRASVGLIQGALKEREEELISQFDQMTEEKLKHIAARRDRLEQVGTRLKSCCGFLQECMRTDSQVEVQAMATSYVKKVQDVTSLSNPRSPVTEVYKVTTVAREEANLDFFSSDDEITQICQKFGSISISNICHAKCSAEGTGLHVAVVGEAATVTVHLVDEKGMKYQRPMEVSCELVSCSDGSSRVRGEAKRVKDSQYDISYLPQHRGYHILHLRIEDQHIPGSPFPLLVITITPTNIIKNVKGPWGITTNENREIFVVENDRNCFTRFNSQGKKIISSRSYGSELSLPCGVAVSATGDILVCNQFNHCINVFSRDGKALRCVGTRGNAALQFFNPVGIAVHPHSNAIYIADLCNSRIQVLNTDMTFCKMFGSCGFFDGQFRCPRDISFDSAGNVYVVDSDTHCVQVLTPEGRYIRKFGKMGCGKGELKEPKGIAIDSNDIVYVSECSNHRISVFTSGGQFLTSFGLQGGLPGEFKNPNGIAVSNGVIYVSDYNNRVQVF